MKASKFSEAQKASIFKQNQEGRPVSEICRMAGICQATDFSWKKKHAAFCLTRCDDGSYPKTIRVIRAQRSYSEIWSSGPVSAASHSTYHDPASQHDNAFIEAFNGKCRAECLNAHRLVLPLRRRPKS